MAEPMRQRSRHPLLAAIALAGVVSLATGCLYRMPIQQGNFLDPTQVVQLQEGMTKSQVKFLLGWLMMGRSWRFGGWFHRRGRGERRSRTAQMFGFGVGCGS